MVTPGLCGICITFIMAHTKCVSGMRITDNYDPTIDISLRVTDYNFRVDFVLLGYDAGSVAIRMRLPTDAASYYKRT